MKLQQIVSILFTCVGIAFILPLISFFYLITVINYHPVIKFNLNSMPAIFLTFK